jgi:hypothetical protein
MFAVIYEQLLYPLLRRAGTVLATYLVSSGVAQDTASSIANGVVALMLVGVDLINSHKAKQNAKSR